MTSRLARPLAEEATLLALAAVVLIFAPVPRIAPRVPTGTAVCGGTLVGLLLFSVLARRLLPPRVDARVAVAAPLVLLRAAAEEALWRWGVLLALSPAVGLGGATGLSSAGFAAAHGVRQTPRQFASRAAAGGAFALVFVASGRLEAAVAAHAVYNALVVAASAGGDGRP